MPTYDILKKGADTTEQVKFPMSVIKGSENVMLSVSVETGYMTYVSDIITAIQNAGGDTSKLTFVTLFGFTSGNLLMKFSCYGTPRYRVECTDVTNMIPIYDMSTDNVIDDVNSTRIADFINAGTPKEEMPQIRFVSMLGDGTFGQYEDPELMDGDITFHDIKFIIEVTSGAIKDGDTLQLCGMKLYGAWISQDGTKSHPKKKKLRRIVERELTAEEIGQRFLTLTVPYDDVKAMRLFASTGHQPAGSSSLSPMYFRIRRPKGELNSGAEQGRVMTVDAEFSNVVTVWKTCRIGENSVGGAWCKITI